MPMHWMPRAADYTLKSKAVKNQAQAFAEEARRKLAEPPVLKMSL